MENPSHRSFYSDEAAEYEVTRYGSRYGQMFRLLQRKAVRKSLEPASNILDVATGTGQMLPVLSEFGECVVASDITPEMLLEARRNHVANDRILYLVGDATRLPYADGTFDIVASSRFLHLFNPSMQHDLISEMARVVRPGGKLVVDFYSADGRRIFWLPISLYRRLKKKRPENDFRVSIRQAKAMIEDAGLKVERLEGLGNFLLVPLLWLPYAAVESVASWAGMHAPWLSEQFLVSARKP